MQLSGTIDYVQIFVEFLHNIIIPEKEMMCTPHLRGYLKMTSYEPRHSSAYSEDLRWRMIYQKLALGLRYADVSNNLGINKSTIQRTVSLFLTSGNVKKKSYPTPRSYTKLTYPAKLHILHLLIEKPFLYLDEIRDTKGAWPRP